MSQVFEATTSHGWSSTHEPPLREFRRQRAESQEARDTKKQNVGRGERMASVAAGSILGLLGLGRRDWWGLGIAGVGAALMYRGATGRCSAYKALGIDTAEHDGSAGREGDVRVTASFLINKPADELYNFWRQFENLPKFMRHLNSVRQVDQRYSHWVAKAPKLYGGTVEWDAEITTDVPNSRIEWRSLEDSDVHHHGSVEFAPALGDRGTKVTVRLAYQPPGGQLGRWTAKLFGEEPEQQIHDDLRNFKRIMEIGEVLTIEGQPNGTCMGRGKRYGE